MQGSQNEVIASALFLLVLLLYFLNKDAVVIFNLDCKVDCASGRFKFGIFSRRLQQFKVTQLKALIVIVCKYAECCIIGYPYSIELKTDLNLDLLLMIY